MNRIKTPGTGSLILLLCILLPTKTLSVHPNGNQQQDYTGTYSLSSGEITLTLELKQEQFNTISGVLKSSNGMSYLLEGMINEGIASGVCRGNQGGIFFEAFLDGNDLTLSLIEPDEFNMPDYDKAQYLVLTRTSQQGSPGRHELSPLEQLTQPSNQQQYLNQSQQQFQQPGQQQYQQQGTPQDPFADQVPPANLKSAPPGNEEAGDETYGYKFRKPAGWNHQNSDGYILLGSNTIPGLIIVFPHQAASQQAMVQEMVRGIQEEGINLSLSGQVQQVSGTVATAFFSGIVQGEQARGYGIGLQNPGGGGLFILAVSTPEKLGNEIMEAANTICTNVTFFKPSTGDQDLVRHFAGEWFWSNGYRTSWMMFFPDGSYSDQYESSYSGNFQDGGGNVTGNWGVANQDSNRGRWTVHGTKDKGMITVISQDGSQNRYEYSVFVERGEKFYWEYMFNGYHYRKNKAY